MVAAPVSYSGNQSQPPSGTGNNPDMSKYAPPQPHTYATPNAPISILLPYGGQVPSLYPTAGQPPNMPTTSVPVNNPYPPTSTPYPPVSAAPPQYNTYPPSSMAQPSPYTAYHPNSSQLTNTYPPNSSGINQPQPYHYGQAPSAYPPNYPPHPNNPQAPGGYPQGQYTGMYPPALTSTYPQTNPTSQAHNVMGTYPPTPTAHNGVYPPPPTGGVYPPRY